MTDGIGTTREAEGVTFTLLPMRSATGTAPCPVCHRQVAVAWQVAVRLTTLRVICCEDCAGTEGGQPKGEVGGDRGKQPVRRRTRPSVRLSVVQGEARDDGEGTPVARSLRLLPGGTGSDSDLCPSCAALEARGVYVTCEVKGCAAPGNRSGARSATRAARARSEGRNTATPKTKGVA